MDKLTTATNTGCSLSHIVSPASLNGAVIPDPRAEGATPMGDARRRGCSIENTEELGSRSVCAQSIVDCDRLNFAKLTLKGLAFMYEVVSVNGKDNDDEAVKLYIYAKLLSEGEYIQGGKPDKVEALKYYKRAAKKGYTDAYFAVGSMLYFGHGTPDEKPNYHKALKYFVRAADKGYGGYAHLRAGIMYYYSQGTATELSDDDKDHNAFHHFNMYLKSLGLSFNENTGKWPCDVVLDDMDVWSVVDVYLYLSILYQKGGVNCSPSNRNRPDPKVLKTKGFKTIQAALNIIDRTKNKELIDDKARRSVFFNYGRMLRLGIGTSQNILTGEEYLKKAAELGQMQAWCILKKAEERQKEREKERKQNAKRIRRIHGKRKLAPGKKQLGQQAKRAEENEKKAFEEDLRKINLEEPFMAMGRCFYQETRTDMSAVRREAQAKIGKQEQKEAARNDRPHSEPSASFLASQAAQARALDRAATNASVTRSDQDVPRVELGGTPFKTFDKIINYKGAKPSKIAFEKSEALWKDLRGKVIPAVGSHYSFTLPRIDLNERATAAPLNPGEALALPECTKKEETVGVVRPHGSGSDKYIDPEAVKKLKAALESMGYSESTCVRGG